MSGFREKLTGYIQIEKIMAGNLKEETASIPVGFQEMPQGWMHCFNVLQVMAA